MEAQNTFSRRTVVKSSIFGLLATSIPAIGFSRQVFELPQDQVSPDALPLRYPSIDDEIVASVVGASHFNLERVQELVNHRPELARATWDWSFGDWETAIGAASHVGRRDIVEFLMSKGARPDIFTYATLGAYDAVKNMIEATPGIQSIDGPHGISLLEHAKNGLRSDTMPAAHQDQAKMLVEYLESLGNAEGKETYLKMQEDEKEKYLGDYMYGEGPKDGLSIKLNMRDNICLGKLGAFGGALYQMRKNVFTYNGTSSIEITFQIKDDKVQSLTIHEPDLTLIARKV
jgi:hypothetical protein